MSNQANSLIDLKGVIHVHTDFSDGSGKLPDVIDAARDTGLDFLALTDHRGGRRESPFPESGWRDGVLLLSGCEISHKRGHVLCFGLRETRNLKRKPLAECLSYAKGQGAVCFVAHPTGVHKPLFQIRARRWMDWSIDNVAGLEMWSYVHDWADSLSLRAIWRHLYKPDTCIGGVPYELTRRWDELARRKKIVGIGGLDAHGGKLFLGKLPPSIKPEIFSYRRTFATIRTHVLSHPLTGDDQADSAAVIGLLARGQSYFSYDKLADPTGFRFWAECDGKTYEMGSEVHEENLTLRVRVPQPVLRGELRGAAEVGIRLIKDGRAIERAAGRELSLVDASPGVYRVEVRLGPKSWIYSNPIWLKGE